MNLSITQSRARVVLLAGACDLHRLVALVKGQNLGDFPAAGGQVTDVDLLTVGLKVREQHQHVVNVFLPLQLYCLYSYLLSLQDVSRCSWLVGLFKDGLEWVSVIYLFIYLYFYFVYGKKATNYLS